MTAADREHPNSGLRVEYPPPRPPIVRSTGETPSERYLAELADKSFLRLWSYPNAFIDKKQSGKGDGKELCDLLVICGDHVLIFSDKSIAWPHGNELPLAWKRWARRSIAKSVAQIRGAQRWIEQFPDRIFIDRQCTHKLPIALPPLDRRKIHGIVVALGAGKISMEHFGGGVGSLAIVPEIKGDQHWTDDSVPLTIGDVSPDGPFIHVLDDATLDILLRELDTITDFTSYLTKKEAFIRSGRLIGAGGDEDLLAYYMKTMSAAGEHDFAKPDGTAFGDGEHVSLDPGIFADLMQHPQYLAKKQADRVSYAWDQLLDSFINTILDGTSIVPEGQPNSVAYQERAVRHMALVSRFQRRLMGEGLIGAFRKSLQHERFTRSFVPGPTDPDQETAFFFMTIALPSFPLPGGYEQYRQGRGSMLEAYAYALLEKHPNLRRVIGIAREPAAQPAGVGVSEDLLMLEDVVWSEELKAKLAERKKLYNIMTEGNYTQQPARGNEFPEVLSRNGLRPVKSTLRERLHSAAKSRREAARRKK